MYSTLINVLHLGTLCIAKGTVVLTSCFTTPAILSWAGDFHSLKTALIFSMHQMKMDGGWLKVLEPHTFGQDNGTVNKTK